jgi:cytochrome b561
MQTEIATPKNYSTIQKSLHWLVALLIMGQLISGDSMSAAWRAFERSADASGFSTPLVLYHIWAGLSVTLFAAWRLWLRRTRGVPALPKEEPLPMRIAAHATHTALYGLMFIAPITGAATYFGWFSELGEIHELAKPAFIGLVLLHAGGALYHHFALDTDVLKRMTNG